MNTFSPDALFEQAGTLAYLRIAFLYNHDELHQVAHTAPIISQLMRNEPNLRVDVITSSAAQAQAVGQHLDKSLSPPGFYLLEPSTIANVVERLSGRLAPFGRIGNLTANLDLFDRFDALIVPETTTTLLKSRHHLATPKLIHMPHGAGDRSIAISPDIRHFDFVLLPGNKTRDRMLAAGVIKPDNHAVIGYPKFDSPQLAGKRQFFDNDRPTVLYNPHFDPKLSSWFKFGEKLLDYFANQDRYNLIVAPHIMLFRRKILASVEHRLMRFRRKIPKKFRNIDHIRIDTGSVNSVDMSYTRAADIYIGDVSSQIYEFIAQPRPAIFLNSHGAKWQGHPDYRFWTMGPVIDDMAQFERLFAEPVALSDHFRQCQIDTFNDTFDLDQKSTSSSRAAQAIANYLKQTFG